MLTVELTAELTPTEISLVEVTALLEETTEQGLTAELTAEVTLTVLPVEVTDAVTAPVEATPEITPEAEVTALPDDTGPMTQEASLTVAPVSSPLLLITLVGLAHYQHRLPDDAAIQVIVRDVEGNLLSQTVTNAAGVYQVQIPAGESYWLQLTASQHLRVEMLLPPNSLPPEIWLAGGDLNPDGCINQPDVDLLTAAFSLPSPDADINGDGIISAVDLAILTGNYQPVCALSVTATPQSTPAPVVELNTESTAEVTEALNPATEVVTGG